MVLADLPTSFKMPIFQDDLQNHDREHPYDNVRTAAPARIALDPPSAKFRRLSEESLPTELCEGPVPDSPERPSTPQANEEPAISNRAELIERLKRGESPTWAPSRRVCSPLRR